MRFSYNCISARILNSGHNSGTICDKDVVRITRTHACITLNSLFLYPRIPELRFLDSSSSSPSASSPLAASPFPAVCETAKMSNCKAGVRDDRLRLLRHAMESRFPFSLFSLCTASFLFVLLGFFLPRRERKKENSP